ncbi:MAG: VWA domain-containing protein [Planctomycetota bacterium]|nr:MAG: VWA domain-containing protein [Planctomycetota bacterium]
MTYVRRLKAVGAVLALTAIISTSHIWGDSARKAPEKRKPGAQKLAADQADEGFSEDLAASKFDKGGVVSYRTSAGELLFALQLKPKLEAGTSRPRDYLLLVDTSASQAQGPLAMAEAVVESLIAKVRPEDRISLWTVNVPKFTDCLTYSNREQFQAPNAPAVKQALAKLKEEVPLGNTDLKKGIERATESFPRDPSREQVIVFLGDGMSVFNPISTADRTRLCENMVKNHIVFYSVPLGPRLEAKNLHGFATGTGGTIVRVLGKDTAKPLPFSIPATSSSQAM